MQPMPQDFKLPPNVTATTSAPEAIIGAQCAIHAVPVQVSAAGFPRSSSSNRSSSGGNTGSRGFLQEC